MTLKPNPIRDMLENFREIVDGSDGVTGWHLNGVPADWGHFNISVDDIDAAIAEFDKLTSLEGTNRC